MYKKNAINTVFLYGIIYPDDEVTRQIKPVFSRVSATCYPHSATKVQQILNE